MEETRAAEPDIKEQGLGSGFLGAEPEARVGSPRCMREGAQEEGSEKGKMGQRESSANGSHPSTGLRLSPQGALECLTTVLRAAPLPPEAWAVALPGWALQAWVSGTATLMPPSGQGGQHPRPVLMVAKPIGGPGRVPQLPRGAVSLGARGLASGGLTTGA